MSGLRLAFVTTYDASNLGNWSGTPYHMARELERQGASLTFIGPLRKPTNLLGRSAAVLCRKRGGRHESARDGAVLRAYARQVSSRLAQVDVDAVFSPGTIPIALLETDRPILFWTDSTFASVVGYYPEWSGLCDASVRAGHRQEKAAIERADAALYSSQWAADSAVNDYGADPAKVHLLPFGANLTQVPGPDDVASLIANRPRGELRLLLLGVDWERKGGDRALALVEELVRRGIPARLVVAGPRAGTVPASPLIEDLGFIDKSTAEGESRLARVLGESHFLCLPGRCEAYGIVFCEASAMGVPSIAIRTGGIATAVRDGANGRLFGESEFVDAAADFVVAQWADYDRSYIPLAGAARREYESRLNWETSTRMLLQHAERLVGERR